MNDLILVENISGKAMTTSLKIAEVFGKEHNKVLRDIREKQHLFGVSNFGQSEYVNNQGHKMPMYFLDRDFATFLIMGYNGSRAEEFKLKYIKAFNDMEAVIKGFFQAPKTFSEALRLAADLQEKIEKDAPKVGYYQELVDKNLLTNFRDTAKELGLKQNEFIEWLIDHNFVYRDKSKKLKPYSEYCGSLFAIKDTKNDTNGFVGTQTMITVNGKNKFRQLLNK